jgi:hypothetical protein
VPQKYGRIAYGPDARRRRKIYRSNRWAVVWTWERTKHCVSPAQGNIYDVSQNLVSEKRQKIEHSDSKLNNSFPEKASGKDRLVSHGYYAPTRNSTNERGNPETNSRNTAEHRSSATKSGKPSYTNKPHINPRRTQQSDSDSDGNKRRRIATKYEDATEGDTSDTDD